MKQKLVLVGNGMAGIAFLEKLLQHDRERYDVTVFGAEKYPNYNRIQLTPVLAGQMGWDDIILNPESWYSDNNVRLHLGVQVDKIDRDARVVTGTGGITESYDRLVIATGSNPIMLPIPGADKEGVIVFRTIDDCKYMETAAGHFQSAAVIGGGLLGLEAARGLKNLGMDVTVVHLAPWLMERQLDAEGGAYLARAIRRQEIKVLLSTQTTEILGNGRVEALRFKDGSELECDLVVMAVGIKANLKLAQEAGLECRRGIVVDDFLRTSDPAVYAVGECVEHRGTCYGLVAPLYEQGRVLAAHLAEKHTPPYTGSIVSTKLKVSGVDVFSAGNFEEDEHCDLLRVIDSGLGVYKKAVVKDGRLIGAVLVGEIAQAAALEQLVRSGRLLNGERATLLSEPAKGPAPEDDPADLMNLPGDTIICGCNGVSKGTIIEAIHGRNLRSRKDVAACTGASRSCGGCGPQVEAFIRLIHGESAAPVLKCKPLCDCTDLSRDEVVRAIRERHLTAVRETMNVLGWSTEGCSTCRPAINYFLTMCWPGENEDDPRSRIANERVHANIQRDGTFSVIPRIYGGVTTPDELMRIAQVAKKYNVPTVKITGGQRIDLLGIKKEQLPHAYAKAVRTVKTCVGSDWCRFGTRDSIGMGIRIEKTFENLWTPAKVKMAVNGCPRNCAESLVKDVGLIAVDTAWEIYVGGNGGVRVRTAELLCTVEDEDEAIDVIGAFLQLYREEANYNERTAVWCEHVGMEYVRQRVVEDKDGRRRLVDRIQKALQNRADPWKDRVRKMHEGNADVMREYAPLAVEGAK
jgi:nitrite reductase (NADH) large subunit